MRIFSQKLLLLTVVALWVAVILTLWSMFHYLRLAAPYLRSDRR